MMRKKIVAGNWKMNTSVKEGVIIAEEINAFMASVDIDNNIKKIILAVPFTHIDSVVKAVDYRRISISAQNCSEFDKGAFTGEISASMIKGLGAHYVIVGHSERRQYFGDTDEIIAKKIELCHKNTLFPIFCCGEKLEQRQSGEHFKIVENQIKNAFKSIDVFNITRTVIAYEPVWAIGTGQTATPIQAQEMHEFIRNTIANLYNKNIADQISILYGGSVNADTASELFQQNDIDGGLVGGASLKIGDFIKIIKSL